MCRQLQIAKVYKVELEYGGLCSDELDAFTQLLDLFDIEVEHQNQKGSELEIERAQLEFLRGILTGENNAYAKNAEAAEDILAEAGMTREKMVAALDEMICTSDQDDSLVHIFCD